MAMMALMLTVCIGLVLSLDFRSASLLAANPAGQFPAPKPQSTIMLSAVDGYSLQCLHDGVGMFDPAPSSSDATDALLLVSAQPRFPGLTEHALAHKIDDESAYDADKCDWIHPMDIQVKDFHTYDNAPKVASQQANVEEGCGC